MNVVEYSVTTGGNVSPEQASAELFPGCQVVWIGEDRMEGSRSVTYFYLVSWDDPPTAA